VIDRGEGESPISENMLFDREETRAQKIGEFLLLLSGKIETKTILFYSFIYIA